MLANDQRDRVLNEVAVMAKSNNLRFQSGETSALFDTFDSSDRPELHELLSLLTHDDAAPCGKGWEGTKPPGCKRSSSNGSGTKSTESTTEAPAKAPKTTKSQKPPTKEKIPVKPKGGDDVKPAANESQSEESQKTRTNNRPNTGKHSDIKPPKNAVIKTIHYEVVDKKGVEITKDKNGKEINRRQMKKDEFVETVNTEFGGKYQAAQFIGKTVEDPKIVAANEEAQVGAMSKLAGISKDQAVRSKAAIRDFSGQEYGDIRRHQRGILKDADGDDFPPERIKKLDATVSDINKFIENAPTFDGEVYRGMMFGSSDERKKFLSDISGGYELEAMSSFSSSKKIASDFASGGGVGVIFKVQNKSGVSIRGLSDVLEEDEVLTPKGARYRIKGTPKKSGSNIHVELEEY